MENSPLKEIFERYLENKCSQDDLKSLVEYFKTDNDTEISSLIQEELTGEEYLNSEPHLERMSAEVFDSIKQRIQQQRKGKRKGTIHFLNWSRVAIAACLILLLGSGIYLTTQQKAPISKPPQPVAVKPPQDTLAPGANKAMLTLSNGQQINLDNTSAGQIAKEANAVIRKTEDGKIVYATTKANTQALSEVAYNTLTTPRGGKYDLTLSDGTRVWLNAASSIKYPSVFYANQREVQITGEVYFEVAHDPKKSFRVIASGQTIEDIGTSFNVNAYTDEPSVKTTLVEGKVRLSNRFHSTLLNPGQQAVVLPNLTISVNANADIDEALAWHHDLFTFHDADIQTVMRQLSRWYDVDIVYEGAVTKRKFSGKIYRSLSASKVADILSYKKIRFRIEGRKIIVMS